MEHDHIHCKGNACCSSGKIMRDYRHEHEQKPKPQVNLEFGQKIVLVITAYVLLCTTASYILCFMGLASNEMLTMAFWGQGGVMLVILGYFAYQFGLKNSRNKYLLDAQGNPIFDSNGNPIMRN